MKLVEIKDVRLGQVLERDRCIFVIEERTGAHNFAVSLYCHNHKPAPNDAYEEQSTRERNVATFDDCEIIGKIGITHRIDGDRLIEIPRTAGFQTDDVVKFKWNPRLYVINREIDFGIKKTHPDNSCFEATNDLYGSRQLVDFELKRIGILGVTHEFVNDREVVA
jgi:hypothetical protein